MKALFCEHPNKPLRGGYCSYYSEMYYALKGDFDIDFKNVDYLNVIHNTRRFKEIVKKHINN